jgi:hypothetical protein
MRKISGALTMPILNLAETIPNYTISSVDYAYSQLSRDYSICGRRFLTTTPRFQIRNPKLSTPR